MDTPRSVTATFALMINVIVDVTTTGPGSCVTAVNPVTGELGTGCSITGGASVAVKTLPLWGQSGPAQDIGTCTNGVQNYPPSEQGTPHSSTKTCTFKVEAQDYVIEYKASGGDWDTFNHWEGTSGTCGETAYNQRYNATCDVSPTFDQHESAYFDEATTS
jgi:hypothetical protein